MEPCTQNLSESQIALYENSSSFVEVGEQVVYKISEMSYTEYDEPPANSLKPGLYHPLCCYVRALFCNNGLR